MMRGFIIAPFGQKYLMSRAPKRLLYEERGFIWQNASLWYETQGLLEQALVCYLQGNAYLQAQTFCRRTRKKQVAPKCMFYLTAVLPYLGEHPFICNLAKMVEQLSVTGFSTVQLGIINYSQVYCEGHEIFRIAANTLFCYHRF